jgi:anti-anti-sigma regulatory factor
MLRITSEENNQTVRLKLEGKLQGIWVSEMERYWHSTTSDRNKALIVDLTDVEYVDIAGRYLLALMHAHGAGFIADTPMMTELVAEISAQPVFPH